MDTNTYWSFNRIGDDCWVHDLCDTKEEAETIGRTWAKENGLSAFMVGKCEPIPIPIKIDIDSLFEMLDEDYFNEAEMDDYDFCPYWDSRTPENAKHRERLSTKITEALKEYVEAAKITGSNYRVTSTYKIGVESDKRTDA